MRTRPLTNRRGSPANALGLELRPRFRTVLAPDPAGTQIEIEIDRVLAPEDGEAVLVLATRALLHAGVFPLLPVELHLPGAPIRPLTLLVTPPRAEVILDPDVPVARALLLEGGTPLFPDLDLFDDGRIPARAFGIAMGAGDADATVETVTARPEPDPRG